MSITSLTNGMVTGPRAQAGAAAANAARAESAARDDLSAAGTAFEALLLKQLLTQALPAAGAAGDWGEPALEALAGMIAARSPLGVARELERMP